MRPHQVFGAHLDDGAGGIQADPLQGIDDPAFDLVAEFLQVYIIDFDLVIAVYVDLKLHQAAGEFNVGAALTDGQADLVGLEVNLGAADFSISSSMFETRAGVSDRCMYRLVLLV